MNLAVVLARRREFDEARELLEEVIARDPANLAAHTYLGMVLIEQGEFERARSSLEFALKLDAEHAAAHFHLSQMWEKQGDDSKAAAHLRDTLRIAPHDQTARSRLERLQAKAIWWAEKSAQATNFSEPAILKSLALAYAEAGRHDRAASAASQALRLAQQRKNTKLARVRAQVPIAASRGIRSIGCSRRLRFRLTTVVKHRLSKS